MRPIVLNDTDPERLYRRACGQMAAQVPGWSDEYPSDPAVAVLELAARLSGLQNRTFDRVEPRHELAYLKLLGEAPEEAAPASLLARALDRTGLFPGRRFWVDGIPFEVEDAGADLGAVERVSVRVNGIWRELDGVAAPSLAGDAPALEAVFSRPLPAGRTVRLWCALRPEPGRTPPDGETEPPVRLRALAQRGGTWRAISLRDGTCGLLTSGFWELEIEEDCPAVRVEVLGEPEGEPRLEALVLEPVLLVQRRTRSAMVELPPPFLIPKGLLENYRLRFFLPAEGGGWRESSDAFVREGRAVLRRGSVPEKLRLVAQEPDLCCEFTLREIAQERVFLDEDGILPRSLSLMAEEDGVWYDCPVGEPVDPGNSRGCRFLASSRELCFGDGRDFPVPKAGRLTVSSCACSAGSAGNGAGGLLRAGQTLLAALAPAAGGRDREPPREALLRAVREQEEPLRAIALEDFEALALKTPGLALLKARSAARKGEPGVVVYVKPRSGPLTRWQRGRILAFLERARPLGVPVTVEALGSAE